jgi:hypothetical protein
LSDQENSFCGIDVCLKVLDAVPQVAQAEMLEKASEKDSRTERSASAAKMSEAESYDRVSKMKQQVLSGTGSKTV